jgi:hypothetical protein
MTCTDVRERIDDYVDGELASPELHEVELHLASCAACREEERELRALLAHAAALPKAVTPPRDLWTDISREIASRPRVLPFVPRRVLYGGLAAAAALVVALVVPHGGPRPQEPAGAASTAPAFAAAHPENELRDAEADYDRATNALLATLQDHRDQLAPETIKSVEQNLAVIDEALREVQAALDKDPGNAELTRMLAATHRKKVDVLRRVVKLSTNKL